MRYVHISENVRYLRFLSCEESVHVPIGISAHSSYCLAQWNERLINSSHKTPIQRKRYSILIVHKHWKTAISNKDSCEA